MLRPAILSLAVLAALPARAAEPLDVQLGYTVHAGGVHVLSVDVEARLDPTGYTMRTKARAEGFFNWATRFQVVSESAGEFGASGPLPRLYTTRSDGRWGVRTAELGWGREREPVILKLAPPLDDDGEARVPIPAAERSATIDPLAATLAQAFARGGEPPCQEVSRVYDGRRRYDLVFERGERTTLTAARLAPFAGPALRCTVRYRPVGGHLLKYADETQTNGQQPLGLWLAEGVHPRVNLPVRLEAELTWGSIIIHLRRAAIDGRTVLAGGV